MIRNAISRSDLCTRCGMCCDGTLFATAHLRPDEAPPPGELSEEVVIDGQRFFRQPCSFLKDCRCTVYDRRYAVCRGYRCALLRRVDSGEIAEDMALVRVAEAQRLQRRQKDAFNDLSARYPGQGPSDDRLTGSALIADPAERRAVATARLSATSLRLFLAAHFAGPDRRPDGNTSSCHKRSDGFPDERAG